MTSVHCLGGQTQIIKVLRHAARETERRKVSALVFAGDCMEEPVDALCHEAGKLGVLGVPAFMFHEGQDPVAAKAFQQVAKLTGVLIAISIWAARSSCETCFPPSPSSPLVAGLRSKTMAASAGVWRYRSPTR